MFKACFLIFLNLLICPLLAFGQTLDRPSGVHPQIDPNARGLTPKIRDATNGNWSLKAEGFQSHQPHNSTKESEKQLLKKGLIHRSQGTESSGGGSLERRAFYEPLGEAIRALSQRTFYQSDDQSEEIDMEILTLALRAVTPEDSKIQLYDRRGKPVDFYNDPKTFSIHFNFEFWENLSKFDKIQFGLHELMGLVGVRDPYYRFSKKLAELAITILDQQTELPTLFWVDDVIEGTNPLHLLARLKQLNTTGYISNYCEKYKPGFAGICLIIQTSRYGVAFEEVLLIH